MESRYYLPQFDDDELAAIYLRISKDREGKRLGIERQEKLDRQLASRLGVRVGDRYCDNDKSASPNSQEPRPDYDRLISDAKAGKIKVIIAYSTSRLTRRPREFEDLIELAQAYGIKFFFVASPTFDLNTADGREAARNAAAKDTGEVERLRERILAKKVQDAEKGLTSGGPRIYGYGKVLGKHPTTGKEICDPYQWRDCAENSTQERDVLLEGKARTLAGHSTLSVIKDWDKRGIQTSKGKRWTSNTYKRTLLNESYVIFDAAGHPPDCECLSNPATGGTRIHGDTRHRALWPGLFTPAEHQALTAVFANTAHKWGHRATKGRTYPLSGIVYCGKCGGIMYGQGRKEKNGPYKRKYQCKKYNSHGDVVGCASVVRLAEPVEKFVSGLVLDRFDTPEVHRALSPHDNEDKVNELVQTVARLSKRKETLATEHAIEPYDDYRTMVATIKAQIEAASTELARLRSEKAQSLLLPNLDNVRELYAAADPNWQHSVIRLLVEKVVIRPGRPGAQIWEGYRFDRNLIEVSWLH